MLGCVKVVLVVEVVICRLSTSASVAVTFASLIVQDTPAYGGGRSVRVKGRTPGALPPENMEVIYNHRAKKLYLLLSCT